MTKKERKRPKSKITPTPPQPKPCDVAPPPAEGDAEKDTLFAAVGSALSAWEGLEGRLSLIFGTLVSPNQVDLAAQRAYGSLLSFRGRGDMIDAAAAAVFFLSPNNTLQKTLSDLVKEIQNFAARRNEIAHGKITDYYRPASPLLLLAGAGHRRRRVGYVLEPTMYATKKTKLKPGRVLVETAHHEPTYVYSSAEIMTFQRHFERLTKQAQKVLLKIWRHQGTQQKS